MSDNHLQIIEIKHTSEFPEWMALFTGRDFKDPCQLADWYQDKTGRLVHAIYKYVRPTTAQIMWAIDLERNGNGT